MLMTMMKMVVVMMTTVICFSTANLKCLFVSISVLSFFTHLILMIWNLLSRRSFRIFPPLSFWQCTKKDTSSQRNSFYTSILCHSHTNLIYISLWIITAHHYHQPVCQITIAVIIVIIIIIIRPWWTRSDEEVRLSVNVR